MPEREGCARSTCRSCTCSVQRIRRCSVWSAGSLRGTSLTLSPIEEAAQGYRDTLHSHLEELSTELQDLEQRRTKGRRTVSELEENFKSQTERTQSVFENLKDYLEREKQQLLSRLEQVHEENWKKIEAALALLEEELTTHRDLVAAIEGQCELSDTELLMGVQGILGRCDSVKGQNTKDQNTECLRQQDPFHERIMEIKEDLSVEVEWCYVKSFKREVTLDPNTAHRSLILSEDGRSVRDGGKAEDLLDTPERFNSYCIVLGRERLSSGRHYWEVEVGDAPEWYLGVCDECARRKGDITLETKDGYWVVCLIDGKYLAHTPPYTPLIPHRAPPRVVGLFLDCEVGKLSVYNAQDRSLLFTFSGVSSPHTLRPLFSPEFSEGGNPAIALQIDPAKERK